MIITKRQPTGVGEMITKEFLLPLDLTQGRGLAEELLTEFVPVNGQ